MVNNNVLFWRLHFIPAFDMISPSRKVSAWWVFRSRLAKEGGERMTDYELLMIMFTVLSLVVMLITKDKK